jgi:hypothetical protein
MLPICAGLLPSAAEEELEAAPSDPYLLADVWAQSLGLQVGGRRWLQVVRLAAAARSRSSAAA